MAAASNAAPKQIPVGQPEPAKVTLLELVEAISDVSRNEAEVVATVLYMLRTGRVRLGGNFRNCPLSDFD